MKIKQYDSVLLEDGRKGCVVEVFEAPDMYLVDVGSSPKDWENITAYPKDIKRILRSST